MTVPFYQGYAEEGATASPPFPNTAPGPPEAPTHSLANGVAPHVNMHMAGSSGAAAPRDSDAFHRLYLLQEEIGRGAFSVVHRCTHRVSGEEFAVKIIDLRPLQLRENFDQSRLRREVEIMRRLNHPNIIRLEEVYETATSLLLVLEYAKGTELFDSILQKKHYTETEARPIFEQVAHALGYLHSLQIVHRDIKPENVILLDKPSPQGYYPCAKLLDFGLSKMIGQDDGSAARTFVGTPCYLAPEVEARAYGRGHAYGTKVDCWSLGAVLYVMLVARFPEFDRSGGSMRVKLESPAWSAVSESAKDLIRCLMQPDPNLRYSVQQALQHPWVTGLPVRPPAPSPSVGSTTSGLMHDMGRMGLSAGVGLMAPPSTPGMMMPPLPQGGLVSHHPPYPHHQQQQRMYQPSYHQPVQQPFHPQQGHYPPHHHHGLFGSGEISGIAPGLGSRTGSDGSGSSSSGPAESPHMSEQGSFEALLMHQPQQQQQMGGAAMVDPAGSAYMQQQQMGGGRHFSYPTHQQQQPGQSTPMEVYKLTPSGDQVGMCTATPTTPASTTPWNTNSYQNSSYPVRTKFRMEPGVEVVRASVPNQGDNTLDRQMQTFQEPHTALPLVQIQHTIANSIELAHRACEHYPDDADDIKRSAVLCRTQLIYTIRLLRKIEQTATSVLEMFPDLELAVEDNEPSLAHEFFATVKRWVAELRQTVADAQVGNQESMLKLHKIITGGPEPPAPRLTPEETSGSSSSPSISPQSSTGGMSSQPAQQSDPVARTPSTDMETSSTAPPPAPPSRKSSRTPMSPAITQVRTRDELEAESVAGRQHRTSSSDEVGQGHVGRPTWTGAVTQHGVQEKGVMALDPELYQAVKKLKEAKENDVKLTEAQLFDLFFSVNGGSDAAFGGHGVHSVPPPVSKTDVTASKAEPKKEAAVGAAAAGQCSEGLDSSSKDDMRLSRMEQSLDGGQPQHGGESKGESGGADPMRSTQQLSQVLGKLRDVDHILEHLAIFWAQTEVVLDVLLQKSEHVERFVEYAHKPRLLSRFQKRMEEYREFWASVQAMCRHYTMAIPGPPHHSAAPIGQHMATVAASAAPRYYGFLESEQRR